MATPQINPLSDLGDIFQLKTFVSKSVNNIYEQCLALQSEIDMKCFTKPKMDNPELTIMVGGAKKAGKSSLLNTLIGEELFPVQEQACTFHINVLKYGDKCTITQAIDIDNLVCNENTQVCDSIQELNECLFRSIPEMEERARIKASIFFITAPIPLLKDLNLTIIDSPGLNEMKTLDKAVSKMLPKVDLLFFVLNSGRSITINDYAFLEMLRVGGDDGSQSFLLDRNKLVLVVSQIDNMPHVEMHKGRPRKTKKFQDCILTCKEKLSIFTPNICFVSSVEQQSKMKKGFTCQFWSVFVGEVKQLITTNLCQEYLQHLKVLSAELNDVMDILSSITIRTNLVARNLVQKIGDTISDEKIDVLSKLLKDQVTNQKQALVDKIHTTITSSEIDITETKLSTKVSSVVKDRVVEEVNKCVTLILRNIMTDMLYEDAIDMSDLSSVFSSVFHTPSLLSPLKYIDNPIISLLALVVEVENMEQYDVEQKLFQQNNIKGIAEYILNNTDWDKISAHVLASFLQKHIENQETHLLNMNDLHNKFSSFHFSEQLANEFIDKIVNTWISCNNVMTNIQTKSGAKIHSHEFEEKQIASRSIIHLYRYAFAMSLRFSIGVQNCHIRDGFVVVHTVRNVDVVSIEKKKSSPEGIEVPERKLICRQLKKIMTDLSNLGVCVRKDVGLKDFMINKDKKVQVYLMDIIEQNRPFDYHCIEESNEEVLEGLFDAILTRSQKYQFEEELKLLNLDQINQ